MDNFSRDSEASEKYSFLGIFFFSLIAIRASKVVGLNNIEYKIMGAAPADSQQDLVSLSALFDFITMGERDSEGMAYFAHPVCSGRVE